MRKPKFNRTKKFCSYLIFSLILGIFSVNCISTGKSKKSDQANFDYKSITKNYFNPNTQHPLPLTVKKGTNTYPGVSGSKNILLYTTNFKGNYDIWLRDLESSISLPITNHPSPEYKPAVSPDGKKLIYVSEELDSSGDLVLMELDSDTIIDSSLSGKEYDPPPVKFLTNPDRTDSFIDTDPIFLPDGETIVFSSDRLSPGTINLVKMNLKSPETLELLTREGGSAAFPSFDGRSLVYLSYRDNEFGEIYRMDLLSRTEERITHDSYIDLSPSLSIDGNSLYFSSIRKDTNSDKVLDERDISRIVRYDFNEKKEFYLTPESYSAFESKFTLFNGGSLLYSASLYNAINIYFLPPMGAIPKTDSISEQYELIKRYDELQPEEVFDLAIDSLYYYFSKDKLFSIYDAKTNSLKLDSLKRKRSTERYREYLQKFSEKQEPIYRAYFTRTIQEKSHDSIINQLNKILALVPPTETQIQGSILELIADEYLNKKKIVDVLKVYNKILNEIPDYYNSNFIKIQMGKLGFPGKEPRLPFVYFDIIESPQTSVTDRITALNDIRNSITNNKNFSEIIRFCDELLSVNQIDEKSPVLFDLIRYIKAEALSEGKMFAQSNALLDQFMKPNPVIDPICEILPSCVQKMPCENDSTCLRMHLLKSKNFENMGKVNEFFEELKIYLLGYDPKLKVEIDKSEVEKNFRYFELRAREHESKGNLQAASFHHFYNTENMYLLKKKNLYVDSLYKNYGVYYQKQMVDTILRYGLSQAEEEKLKVYNRINVLNKNEGNVVSTTSKVFTFILDNPITRNFKDYLDLRNLESSTILGKPGAPDDAIALLNAHFKQSRPRARPVLYLASLYGYAYFLISRGVINETHYRSKKILTRKRKEEIFKDFKSAEQELKWIIFADQEYSEAYQLLGWLYQYLDNSKNLKNDSDITEGEVHSVLYEKYFSGKHIEENIDIYQQILTFLGNDSNEKTLSDLNLNLANNYFYLKNYGKARDHYGNVEKFGEKINPEYHFENYKQKAQFHFNYAKSLIYLGEYEKAIGELRKVYDIYYKNEFLSTTRILSEMERIADDIPVEEKLTIIQSIIGLSQIEIGEYNLAIFSLTKALSLNREKEYIKNINLFNALAFSYYKNGDLNEAYKYIKKSQREYKDKYDSKFSSYLNRLDFWNIILPEKIRIIGEGRFPGEFPVEFQYLFSTGIELGVLEENEEYNRINKLIDLRKDYIYSYRLNKTSVGIRILNNDENLRANILYRSGKYKESYEHYKELLSIHNKDWKIQKRALFSLFRIIEEGEISKETIHTYLKSELDNTIRFKSIELHECFHSTPASNMKENISGINKDCEIKFNKEYRDYESILAYLYYYMGNNQRELGYETSAIYFFSLSNYLINHTNGYAPDMEFLPEDPFLKSERLTLVNNRIEITNALKSDESVLQPIDNYNQISNELKSREDTFRSYLKYIQYHYLNGEYFDVLAYYKKWIPYTEDPYLLSRLKDTEIKTIFEIMKSTALAEKRYQFIPFFEEIKNSLLVEKNYLKHNLQYSDSKLYSINNDLRDTFSEISGLYKTYLYLMNNRKETEPIIHEINKKVKIYNQKKKEFIEIDPLKEYLFGVNLERLEVGIKKSYFNKILVFTPLGSGILYSVFQKSKFTSKYFHSENELSDFQKNVIEELDLSTEGTSFIVVHGKLINKEFLDFLSNSKSDLELSFSIRHQQVDTESLTSIKAITLLEGEKAKTGRYYEKSEIQDTDLLIGKLFNVTDNHLFGESRKGYIRIKDLLENKHQIQGIIIAPENNYDYDLYDKLFLILKSTGIKDVGIDSITDLKNFDFKSIALKTGGTVNFLSEENPELAIHLKNQAIQFERDGDFVEAIDKINRAENAVNSSKNPDIYFEIKLIEARIKTRNYDSKEEFYFYKKLLKLYEENIEKKLLIYNSLLKYCYTYYNLSSCDSHYLDYSKYLLLKTVSSLDRKKYYRELKVYREIIREKNKSIPEMIEKAKPAENEDSFLFHLDFGYFLMRYFYLDESEDFYRKAEKLSRNKTENQRVRDRIYELQVLKELSGFGKKSKPETRNDIYTALLNKDWKRYDSELNRLEKRASENQIWEFKHKIFDIWKKLETGEDYNPLLLSPEYTLEGESVYNLLDLKDLFIISYIFSKSISYQEKNEINILFNHLIENNRQLNFLMKGLMILGYAESHFRYGNLKESQEYLTKYIAEFSGIIGDTTLKEKEYVLQRKLSIFLKTNFNENEKYENKFLEFYFEVQDLSPTQYYSKLNIFLENLSDERYSSATKRELIDLIYLLQKRALEMDSSELFFDLATYRDKLASLNERFYQMNLYVRNLPIFKAYSKDILSTLPENQSFVSLITYGTEMFRIEFSNGKSIGSHFISKDPNSNSGEDLNNSRKFKNEIYNYYKNINIIGSDPITKEFLEKKFRDHIRLNNRKKTYLYLPSFLFKIPIEYKQNDNFFWVTDPEELTLNSPVPQDSFFEKDYYVQKYFSNDPHSRLLNGLEKLEIPSGGKNKSSQVHYSSERMFFKNLDKMLYEKMEPIFLSRLPRREGFWLISNSDLYNSSFLKDDINSFANFLGKLYLGPGILSIGPQYKETDPIFFYKHFLKRTELKSGVKSRFINAIQQTKMYKQKEISWIGYRLITNRYLLDSN